MSYIVRRAAINSSPLRSIQCTRIVPTIVMRPIIAPSRRNYAAHQAEESYDAFNERFVSYISSVSVFSLVSVQLTDLRHRYEKFFFGANDKFEVQRGLNNVFAYDLVPSVKVCEAALRACRRGTIPSGSLIIYIRLLRTSFLPIL